MSFTAQDVKDYCRRHECGIEQAKKALTRQELRNTIALARDVEDLKDILLELFPVIE